MISKLAAYRISKFLLVHVADQTGFQPTSSDTQMTGFFASVTIYRLRAKKRSCSPPPPLENFADISYIEENYKSHLLRDVCTLCSGALVSDSLLHMLL